MERFETRVKKAFAQRLKKARQEAGFRYGSEFAHALRVEGHTYRTWERGTHLPDIPTMTRICRLLNVEPNDLMPPALRKKTSADPDSSGGEREVA